MATPVPISVRAEFTALAPNVLGSAGAQYVWRDFPGATKPGTYYVDALADRLRGADAYPGQFDIMASFNSTFSSWYFGTDGATPAGTYDFVSVVLHELGHGLGFLGAASVTDGSGLVGLGGYATWVRPDGWYVDSVLKANNFDNEARVIGSNGQPARGKYSTPGIGAYWLWPSRIARSSLSTRRCGTGKSGKPWPRLTAPCSAASCDITVKIVVPTFGSLVSIAGMSGPSCKARGARPKFTDARVSVKPWR